MVGSRSSFGPQRPLGPQHLVDRFDHVNRHPDGAGLIGDGPGDGLADPPGGVGGELEALGVIELLHRPHQAEVALLHQVENGNAPPDVAFCDRHHQPQIGGRELLSGPVAVCDLAPQHPLPVGGDGLPLTLTVQPGDLGRSARPDLDPLGQRDLLVGGEQRDLADLLEVHANRIRRTACPSHGRGRNPRRIVASSGPPASAGLEGPNVWRLLVEGDAVVGHELANLGQHIGGQLDPWHDGNDIVDIEWSARFGA